jgi:RecA/RadA recombinase
MEQPPPPKKKKTLVEAAVESAKTGSNAILEKIEELAEERKTQKVNVASIQKRVKKLLKYTTFEPEQRYWLNTGSEELNAVLGSKDYGLPYGKIFELSGVEHGGKTLIGNVLMGMAQKDGAVAGYIDVEDSRDEMWSERLGVDWSSVVPVFAKLIQEGKNEDKLRLQSAEELFDEAETVMKLNYQDGHKKQFWLLDSIAMLQTSSVIEAGATDQNMRTKLDRAMFLSSILPRWSALAANYGAMIFLINQIRTNPGVLWGNPNYTPGGHALRHVCSIRAEVRRIKNGQLKQSGRIVGIVGKIKNEKNKAGQESVQGAACGFKINWSTSPAKVEFSTVDDAEDAIKTE